jgi:rubrerythrin
MDMDTKDLVDCLSELIQLDLAAISAYESAIKACEHEAVAHPLRMFQDDHERHVRELSAKVQGLRGTPPERRDFKGLLMKGFTAVMSRGTHSALVAMRGNEEYTTRTYERVLAEQALPGPLRDLVLANSHDERRHLEWIEQALQARVWERETGASA